MLNHQPASLTHSPNRVRSEVSPSFGEQRGGALFGAERLFTRMATTAAFFTGQPAAFAIAIGLIILWLIGGPMFAWSDTWQLVVNTATTIATFLMVFLIQNSQNRDAAAMQAKLDEVIRALDVARNEFIGIEHLTDSEIEDMRRRLEREVKDLEPQQQGTRSVSRLLERR